MIDGGQDFVAWSRELLDDWDKVKYCRPKLTISSAVDLEYHRTQLDEYASMIRRYVFDKQPSNFLAEACYQFETRLKKFKEKIIIETLTHGSF